jgi:hypothetical protein
MAHHHRTRPLAALLLVILAVRLSLAVVDLVLRALCWALLRTCRALEWAIDRLRGDSPSVSVVRPVIHAAPRPIAAATASDDVAKFMHVLGTKDRQFAESLLARGERVPATSVKGDDR